MDGGSIEKLIQGAIEEYKVATGSNVNAGDFVRFISNYMTKNDSEETLINGDNLYKNTRISAIALDENRVLVAYSLSTSKEIAANICTVSNNGITVGATCRLDYGKELLYPIFKLSPNQVVISYIQSNYYGELTLLEIDRDTINKVHGTTCSYKINVNTPFNVIKIGLNNFMVFYRSSDHSLQEPIQFEYFRVNTAVEQKYSSQIAPPLKESINITMIDLGQNQLLLFFVNTSNYLQAFVANYDNTKIQSTSIKNIDNAPIVSNFSTQKIDNCRILVTYTNEDKLYVSICTYENDSLTMSTPVLIDEGDNVGAFQILTLLEDNRVLLTYNSTENYIKTTVVTIDEASITTSVPMVANTIARTEQVVSIDKINEHSVFILYKENSSSVKGFILDYVLNQIKTVTKRTERIAGVALKNGIEGEIVPIAVPNYIEEE